ncbi:hypothetical protein CRUP_023299 [Coryphaenoides rupestris]|nr:hypothetical protein CRUP_023299 [Coryphaenoides rupestris]
MDLTFILSAVIFTLLAVLVASSVFSSGCPTAICVGDKEDNADNAGLVASGGAAADTWTELSGGSRDHWEVVQSVLSGESESHHDNNTAEQHHTLQPQSMSADSTRRSYDLESLPAVPSSSHSPSSLSSEGGRRSLIGLSEKELLKCAFSYPQTEGAPESPGFHDMQYLPGKVQSKHLESMMSKPEMEEEQRTTRRRSGTCRRETSRTSSDSTPTEARLPPLLCATSAIEIYQLF